jgi:hypothetical protein
MPLYVFLGFPQTCLNAGGLQHCVEQVENLGILEHDPAIQYVKEGVFIVHGSVGERQGMFEYRLSNQLEQLGVTWKWFPENWGFGNGVTTHKTTANRETMLVDHRSGTGLQDLIATGKVIDFRKLRIQQVPKRTEGWDKYEKRWIPGTCPQRSHIIHLTWLVTKHVLPEFAYLRLERLIEDASTVLHSPEQYREKDFSPVRKWEGEASAPSKELLRLLGN